MAAEYHHARRLYIGTTAEMAAAGAVLGVDSIGTEYWDTTVSALYIWDGAAWVPGFAALPHDILSATHADTTPAAVVRGDLMTGQGVAPTWSRLAHPGAADRVLQSTGTEITWSAQVLTLTGSLNVGANTIIGGGGALALGGFIFTVPATGTGVIGGGAGAANRVAYWTDANTLASNAGLFVDAANDLYLVADGGGIGDSNTTARLIFDSSGVDYARFYCNVGIGTIPGPGANLEIAADQVNAELWLSVYKTAPAAGWIRSNRARGTQAVPLVVANNDFIGGWIGRGYSAAAGGWRNAAQINFNIDGVPDSGGDPTDMPGRITFWTTPDGASTTVERMRINNAGVVQIANLAGVGVRAVVADAAGNLSAP